MRVDVRLFAGLRERMGARSVELELWPGASVADALATDTLRDVTANVDCLMAVNRRYADRDQVLRAGDELALIPPVSGGSDAIFVALSAEPLSRDKLSAHVRDPRAGAEVMFTGVTREVASLEFEAYPEMALDLMREVCAAAAERHGLCRVAIAHRIGDVSLSEPCVIVAVSAPHREAAFAGAREVIDTVKAIAPIWKVEVDGDRRHRPQGTPGAGLEAQRG